MNTITIVLLVGGLAVGGYFLYKHFSSASPATATKTGTGWEDVALAGTKGGLEFLKTVFDGQNGAAGGNDPYFY